MASSASPFAEVNTSARATAMIGAIEIADLITIFTCS
jgi:hypothetical protein